MGEKESNRRVNFFGIMIDPLTMRETLQKITEIIEKRRVTRHMAINVAKLVASRRSKELRRAINSCGLINADGVGILWGASFLGIDIPERVAGIDLMHDLVELAASRGYRVYFLGAREEVIRTVITKYRAKYPDLCIAGFHNGYFTREEEKETIREIRDSKPDILFVGMPSPEKEMFLSGNLEAMGIPFGMGVGGSFDIVAGKTKRAPLWVQRIGLEWFYRFCQEPRRLWKRYLMTNMEYLVMLIKAKVGALKNM